MPGRGRRQQETAAKKLRDQQLLDDRNPVRSLIGDLNSADNAKADIKIIPAPTPKSLGVIFTCSTPTEQVITEANGSEDGDDYVNNSGESGSSSSEEEDKEKKDVGKGKGKVQKKITLVKKTVNDGDSSNNVPPARFNGLNLAAHVQETSGSSSSSSSSSSSVSSKINFSLMMGGKKGIKRTNSNSSSSRPSKAVKQSDNDNKKKKTNVNIDDINFSLMWKNSGSGRKKKGMRKKFLAGVHPDYYKAETNRVCIYISIFYPFPMF